MIVEPQTLYVIATPIGNLEDLSPRARSILSQCDIIACEDTRVARRLFHACGISGGANIVSGPPHAEERIAPRVLTALARSGSAALISDAGTPLLSDPGHFLVNATIRAGFSVLSVPGPCAITAALSIAGLPTHGYTFLGFLPRKTGARRRRLEEFRDSSCTIVLFESARRIHTLLNDCLEIFDDRRCALCFELTKRFERVYRGWLSEMELKLEQDAGRGELTVLIGGNRPKLRRSREDTQEN